MRTVAAALAASSVAIATPALAQAYQCRMPGQLAPAQPARGAKVSVPTAYHVLALSWTPEYCRGKAASKADALQCSGRHGRFGLVLHGLWANGAGGRDPQYCAARPAAPPAVVAGQLCRMPSARIIEHEWQKHGTCIARSASNYWARAAKLYDGLRFPDLIRLSRQEALTAGDVRKAFSLANPGYRPASVGLLVSDRGWIKELHLCLDRGFRPMTCPRKAYGPSDGKRVAIWRGL